MTPRGRGLDDPQRVAAVRRHGLQPGGGDLDLDAAVTTLRLVCAADVAAVSVVLPGRQDYPASSGVPLHTTELADDVAFCAAVVRDAAVLEVPDAAADPRWRRNPYVAAGAVGAYAGAPLVDGSGHVLGAVCLFWAAPHRLDDAGRTALLAQTQLVQAVLALREQRRQLAAAAGQQAQDQSVRRAQREVLRLTAAGAPLERVLGELSRAMRRPGSTEGPRLAVARGEAAAPRAVQGGASVVVPFPHRDAALVVEGDAATVTAALGGGDLPGWADLVAVAVGRDADRARLREAAEHDPLTGLLNRTGLAAVASPALAVGRAAAVHLALDEFKAVNDGHGHAAGDAVLVEVAGRLERALRDHGSVARWGSDEFVVLLPAATLTAATTSAAALREVVAAPVAHRGSRLRVTCTAGVAAGPLGADWDGLVRDAGKALRLGKAGGRDRVVAYSQEVRERVERRDALRSELADAVARGRLTVHYQPQYDLRSREAVGLEALVRWRRADGTDVSPVEFVPLAEEAGLIGALGGQVLATACRDLARWRRDHPAAAGVRVWVNVSAHQLEREDFADRVVAALADAVLPAQALGVEVTESVLGQHPQVVRTLHALRATGVLVALDDFGTGYSSLGQLRDLPVDVLKADRSFVRGLAASDGRQAAVLRAVVNVGHALALEVIAEGVELDAEREVVSALGCEQAQGFLWTPAVPAAAVPDVVGWRAAAQRSVAAHLPRPAAPADAQPRRPGTPRPPRRGSPSA